MYLAQAVGKRVKELIFKKGISQYRLIKDTCLNEKTISDLIKGKNKDVKLSTIYLICEVLGMSLNEFFDSNIFDNIEE